MCQGTTKVHFKNEKSFNTGNVFTVQLSNSSGSFASPVTIGTQTAGSTGWDSASVTIPSGTANGTGYQVRIVSTNPIYTSASSANFTIGPWLDTLMTSGPTNFCQGGNVVLTSKTAGTYSWSNSNNTQSSTITASGTYTVTATTNNCSATASAIVTVNTNPSATATNSGPYCSYGTIALTGGTSGLTAYAWSGPNSFTSATQSPTRTASGNGGTYTITVTNSNGCSASASTSVTVNSTPTAAITPADTTVYKGDTITLRATGGTSYYWPLSGSDSSFITVILSADTTIYTAVVTNSYGCTDTIGTMVFTTDSIIQGNLSGSAYCAGAQISIPFTAKGIYGTGNIFTAQLSDSSGSFIGAISIGFDTTVTSGTITATIPDSILAGSHYKIRVMSSYPVFTDGASACLKIGILPDSITPAQQDTVVCPGSTSNIYVPTSQHGIRYDLMTDSAVIISAYGNDSTINLNTGAINNNTIYTVLATDTLSGCNRQLATGITIYTYHVGIPVKAVPQMVLSDTAVTFTFSNITAGFGGNQVVWALDSNFTTQHIDTSPATIVITVHPNSDTLIWLKSRDSVSGCTSYAVLTFAAVDTIPTNTVINDTMQATCAGTTTVIAVNNSQTNVLYKLYTAGMATDSSLGNDSLLFLNTAVIDSNTVYNIIGIDTTTHSIVYADSNIYILGISAVDTPIFITGDTLIYYYDTAWVSYMAIANNSTQIIYSIVDSFGATIDSITGRLDSVWAANFTVRATAYGMPGCNTTYAYQPVTVTVIASQAPPPPIHFTVDSPQVVTITFDTVYAGTYADEIEWSFDPTFASSTIVASPAVISFSLSTGKDTAVYIRSKDSKSGNVSRMGKTDASAALTYLSAGLLDKSQWKLIFNDEFVYNKNNPNYVYPYNIPGSMTNQAAFPWNLGYCWNGTVADGSVSTTCEDMNNASFCGNHTNGGTYTYCNSGYNGGAGQTDGSGNEVIFKNGYVDLQATALSANTLPVNFATDCHSNSFVYKSGMLASKQGFDFSQAALMEIRCKHAGGPASISQFWTTYSPEFDIVEDQSANSSNCASTNYSNATTIHDWSGTAISAYNPGRMNGSQVACGQQLFHRIENTCDFSEDWHTFSCVVSSSEIMFFVDGKETWSELRNQSTPYPYLTGQTVQLIVDLAIANLDCGLQDTYDYWVDYIRFYQLQNPSNPPVYLQNLQGSGSVAKTLETLSASGSSNNQLLPFNSNYPGLSSIVANSKIAVTGTTAAGNLTLFYLGQFGNCYKATQSSTGYIEYPIVSPVWTGYMKEIQFYPPKYVFVPLQAHPTDIKGCLTPVNANLVYFQSTANGLKYLQYASGSWSEHNAVALHGLPAGTIVNCNGYINLGPTNYVWYKGTDENLYLWKPATGNLVRMIDNGSAAGAMIAAANSLTAFYVDANSDLWEYAELPGGGSGNVFKLGSTGNVSNYLALDETNSRVYFIGLDGNVYYYTYNLLYAPPNNLTQLGNAALADNSNNQSICSASANAATGLTLSYNTTAGVQLYFKSQDGNLWYYYNDYENSTSPTLNGQQISAPNWNKSCITCGSGLYIDDYIAVEPSNTGKLFYTAGSAAYYYMAGTGWVNADNPINCPNIDGGNNANGTYALKSDTSVNASKDTLTKIFTDSSLAPIVSVFPNPSDNTFTITINNAGCSAQFDITITDIQGRSVYQADGILPITQSSGSYQTQWNAANMCNGVYLYNIKVNNKHFNGKMVKI